MKCPKCGREIHEEANFCPYCMEKFKSAKLSSVKPVRNIWPMIIMALELIVIIVLVVVVLRKQPANIMVPNDNTETTTERITETTTELESDKKINPAFLSYLENENITCYTMTTATVVEEYIYDEDKDTLFFSTRNGVIINIDLKKKAILYTSLLNAELVDCYIEDGNIIVIIDTDESIHRLKFAFDISVDKSYCLPEGFWIDVLSNYVVYPDHRIEFMTTIQDYFYFDYENFELLYSNLSDAVVEKSYLIEDILIIFIKMNEFANTEMYTIDISKNNVDIEDAILGCDGMREKECITSFTFHKEQNEIEFDSVLGPSYKINIETGEITYCSSTTNLPNGKEAEVLQYKKENGVIEVTVISGELPREMAYAFDISCY